MAVSGGKGAGKGQSTIEFTILMSFMVLMFSVFFILIGERLVDLQGERDYEIAKAIKDVVDTEIRVAKSVEDGYFRTFYLPGTVSNVRYEIEIINSTELVVKVRDKETVLRIPKDTYGNVSKGRNRIEKNSGTIKLTPSTYTITGTFICNYDDIEVEYRIYSQTCFGGCSSCTTAEHNWSSTGNFSETCIFRRRTFLSCVDRLCISTPAVKCTIN